MAPPPALAFSTGGWLGRCAAAAAAEAAGQATGPRPQQEEEDSPPQLWQRGCHWRAAHTGCGRRLRPGWLDSSLLVQLGCGGSAHRHKGKGQAGQFSRRPAVSRCGVMCVPVRNNGKTGSCRAAAYSPRHGAIRGALARHYECRRSSGQHAAASQQQWPSKRAPHPQQVEGLERHSIAGRLADASSPL